MAEEAQPQEPVMDPGPVQQQPPAAPDESVVSDEPESAVEAEVAFSWQASEYVHHHKSSGWYMALFGGLAVLVLGAVLLHFWLSIVLFVMMAVAVVVYARKPPRTLMYELTPKEVIIESKSYPFKDFRSFGVISDEDWHSIDLEPAQRFSPRISLLFENDDFAEIVGHLEQHLPRTDRKLDLIERLSRYLRF